MAEHEQGQAAAVVIPQNPIPVEVRAAVLKDAAYAENGYIDATGALDESKIEDVLYAAVSKAVVSDTKERKTVALTRTMLTRTVFPKTPGPGEYHETDDPEAAEKAWGSLNTYVYRLCDSNDSGVIQQRLNGATSLILCRTNATSEKGVQGVYVTSDWNCLLADWIKPDQAKIQKAIYQASRNGRMGAERLPEHGKKFRRELNSATKAALNSGVADITRQIEASSSDDDADDSDG